MMSAAKPKEVPFVGWLKSVLPAKADEIWVHGVIVDPPSIFSFSAE
jgi:hypothetical protein